MYVFLTILILIAAILMILIVLVQKSKGGDWLPDFRHPIKLWVYEKLPIFGNNMDSCCRDYYFEHFYCKIYSITFSRSSISG